MNKKHKTHSLNIDKQINKKSTSYNRKIYLDNSATTKPKKEVVDAMLPYFYDKWHNPSSLYSPSKEVKKDIENVRKKVAETINAKPNEIFFTSSGSESNSLAIQGLLNNLLNKFNCDNVNVVTSKLEHKSILEHFKHFPCVSHHTLSNDIKGVVNIDDISLLDNNFLYLISVQYANNEIGTIQDIKKLSKYKKRLCFTHTDAVQIFGHMPINVKNLNVDMLSASGHKIGTPKGIGFVYIKEDVQKYITPIICGTQENGIRGGTENVPYIIGLGKAIDLISYDNTDLIKKRKYFEQELIKIGFKINGADNKLPNNISATYKSPPINFTNEALIYFLDMFGIYISSGSACNSNEIKPSYVLKAIGLTDNEIMKTIRITLPPEITKEEIDYVIDKIKKAIDVMKSQELNSPF